MWRFAPLWWFLLQTGVSWKCLDRWGTVHTRRCAASQPFFFFYDQTVKGKKISLCFDLTSRHDLLQMSLVSHFLHCVSLWYDCYLNFSVARRSSDKREVLTSWFHTCVLEEWEGLFKFCLLSFSRNSNHCLEEAPAWVRSRWSPVGTSMSMKTVKRLAQNRHKQTCCCCVCFRRGLCSGRVWLQLGRLPGGDGSAVGAPPRLQACEFPLLKTPLARVFG